ncbi:MAG: peptidoglycan editing factor PgeF [Candidatus Nitrotoga sp.]
MPYADPASTFIYPDWPAPRNVRALQTTRTGGLSALSYNSFNLGRHVGDDAVTVLRNRMLLASHLPSEPVWLTQTHGVKVIDAGMAPCDPEGDACIAKQAGAVCVVMTADCLPVLLCDDYGRVVGAAHAGWRGLCAGVIEAAVASMAVPATTVMAWLGPAIGQQSFEVGEEVRAAFMAQDACTAAAFAPGTVGKWQADIYQLARLRLNALGITRIYGGDFCTYTDPARFFSYRRDGVTGRMGTFIWLEK